MHFATSVKPHGEESVKLDHGQGVFRSLEILLDWLSNFLVEGLKGYFVIGYWFQFLCGVWIREKLMDGTMRLLASIQFDDKMKYEQMKSPFTFNGCA